MPNYIVGFSGIKRSGKNTVAGMFANMCPTTVFQRVMFLGFADAVKEEAANYLRVDVPWINDRKNDIPEIRSLLQRIGQEGRELSNTKWIDVASKKIETFNKLAPPVKTNQLILITDVRYPNEAEWIHKQGGWVVIVERKGLDNNDPHPSETEVSKIRADFRIANNGTYMPDLQREVKWCWQEFMQHYKLL
jgi:hypothetical protein